MNKRHLFAPVWLEGGVAFRLFAPDAESVQLVRGDGDKQAMQSVGDGWYEWFCEQPKTGEKYRFLVDDLLYIPDPASHFQPEDVNGPSELINPHGFTWGDGEWKGRKWEEGVIYELHVGAFSPEGTYAGVEAKLDYLAALGVTAIELMPLADFAGKRNWGYDGVLPHAPDSAYGRPEDLKRLIDAAHARGIMMFLDVVYNHFGPSGNYLHEYAKVFFTDKYQTPWGAAINYEESAPVRDFFIGNALYWLQEYHFDGLRFDAVHAIEDGSSYTILQELAEAVKTAIPQRQVHLILENDKNEARYLARDAEQKPTHYTAQWNDDIHHAFHVLLTDEKSGYYEDYAQAPLQQLGRCLAEGFAYQGEPSPHRENAPRGEKSAHLPPAAFITFLQNHDQIGNRAMGERIGQLTSQDKLTLAMAILLLAPQPPMLFMGEEWAAATPFLFFCDFDGELADAVREGRRKEFARFPEFSDEKARASIPDPNAESTFAASKLRWEETEQEHGKAQLAFTTRMLELRREHILPLLTSGFVRSQFEVSDDALLNVTWQFGDGELQLYANFSDQVIPYVQPDSIHVWGATSDALPAWKCSWFVRPYE